MKKGLLLLCLLLAGIPYVQACDICGCGAGSSYLGILPDFTTRIIGIRYRYNSVLTHVAPEGIASYLTASERYHTAELWGGWTFGNKVRLMASVPLGYDTRRSQEENDSKTGLGDINIQGFYHLLSRRSTLGGSKLLVQDLWIGGGVKLPTGKYEPLDMDESGKSANLFQLGTGSFDFLLTGMYDIRLQDAGLNLSASYKYNTANHYDYDYGNKWNGNAQLYYKFRIKQQATVAPNLGMSYERSAQDLNEGYSVYTSGGYALYGTLGAELQYRKIALGGNWQPVLDQNLAAGVVKAQNRMMLHLSLMF
ncbi:transporter family protein [Taibaiella koreensis]|uniref:transporter n=1 Tax=Taibaiella koreensis TaxID=1268548 RepID=UPI000E59BDFB|nr:transporter [Taibaiella koreensis]